MKRILVTGFDAFGGLRENVSAQVVHQLASAWQGPARLETAVLPTVYERADPIIRSLVLDRQPDAALLLGVARDTDAIRLERVALNLDDSETSDNEGVVRSGAWIDPGGPVAFWSTLPLADMHASLEYAGIPVEFSNHSGAFLCNHAFYAARTVIDEWGFTTQCGFVHLPDVGTRGASGGVEWTVSALTFAVVRCLEVLAASLDQNRPADR